MKAKNEKVKTKNVDKVHLELENMKSMLARALADYDNLSKRVERDRTEIVKYSSLTVISKLLPVLDMLEVAQKHLQDAGLAIGLTEFKKVFSEEGLTEINPKIGDSFDENLMEAIEVVKGQRDNTIAEVVLPGWKFAEGQVVRHAKVKVYKK